MPPKHLSEAARAVWKELAPEYHRRGLLSNPRYLAMFEGGCSNLAKAREMDRIVAKNGHTVMVGGKPVLDDQGKLHLVGGIERKRPEASLAIEYWREARAFLSEFGSSPVGSLKVPEDPIPDDEEKAKQTNRLFGE